MPNPSFAQDIRPLFRDNDVESMQLFGDFDLSQVTDVRAHASKIYERLGAKDMPCDAPWSDRNIALFKAWMDSGMAD
jgi:hypothetical protein